MLGYLAAHNRLGRLRLGVCVTDTARRNPAVTAQAAATLQLLTRGRAILGIGTGEREGNESYGVDWSKPVARFEETLGTIRALWGSEGEPVNRDSAYFPLRNAVFALRRTSAAGRRSGSPRTGHACCASPGVTRMHGFLRSSSGQRITRAVWKSCSQPPPTPAATRRR
jgi:alkanesulfonate monooxygenase SsuD/methylene tetrahydromethanopterin reductase-like flavin-dependent oxidoreductase (luciferase family)